MTGSCKGHVVHHGGKWRCVGGGGGFRGLIGEVTYVLS